jgi:hypothetical protein
MFSCNRADAFTTRILAGLVLAVTIVIGSLTYAVANIQVVA